MYIIRSGLKSNVCIDGWANLTNTVAQVGKLHFVSHNRVCHILLFSYTVGETDPDAESDAGEADGHADCLESGMS